MEEERPDLLFLRSRCTVKGCFPFVAVERVHGCWGWILALNVPKGSGVSGKAVMVWEEGAR